jgi:hypothetical protein
MSETVKKSPFVNLDRCGAIVNDMDYDSEGRLTYMPYNGINSNNNKVISTPDAYNIALEYSKWCTDAINNVLHIPHEYSVEFVKDMIGNIDYTLTHRLRYELAIAAMTIFNSGTRSEIIKYVTDTEKEKQLYYDMNCSIQNLNSTSMFIKDEYMSPRVNPSNGFDQYCCVDRNSVMVKSSRTIAYIITDIANIFNRYIYNVLFIMDITAYTNDSINKLGLERSMVSTNNDLPYVNALLCESSNADLGKIAELVEMLVHHAYYIFCNYYKSLTSDIPKPLIEEKVKPEEMYNDKDGFESLKSRHLHNLLNI